MSGKKIITGLQEAIAMTDRNDLVARLRGFATDRDGSEEVSADARPYLHDAAARIEEQAATIARLTAYIENDADWEFSAKRRLELLREQRARAEAAEVALAAMTAEENRLCADLKRAKDRADADRARLAKAVEALREIAEQTKGVTPEPDNLQMTIGTIHSYARATLAEIGGA